MMEIDPSTAPPPPNMALEVQQVNHLQPQRSMTPHQRQLSLPTLPIPHPHEAINFSPDRRPKKSSTTCTTCRARKVRCNGTRPVCANCQRLGFPCSYDDSDNGAWTVALPRRRVKQACLSCHSRKARCSGHVPACERCRAQGIDCIYRPSKRTLTSSSTRESTVTSPQSHSDERDDELEDSEPSLTDRSTNTTPGSMSTDV